MRNGPARNANDPIAILLCRSSTRIPGACVLVFSLARFATAYQEIDRMRRLQALLTASLLFALLPAVAGEIRWDRYGIPHIYGATIEEAVHGFGYAQMENHAEQLLLNVASARGRSAEYF